MKYKIDTTWHADQDINRALGLTECDLRYQRVPTNAHRQLLFIMCETPTHARPVYEAINVDLQEGNLQSSRGLCAMLYQEPKRGVCLISGVYDGVVGVFSTDTGFRLGQRSMASTAAHEAMHAARRLAAMDLELDPSEGTPLTREYEEAIADWTGYLTVEFLNAMRLLNA